MMARTSASHTRSNVSAQKSKLPGARSHRTGVNPQWSTASATSGQVYAGTITERLLLLFLSVVRAMISAAVPEHSSCTEGTSRKSANDCASDGDFRRGLKSRHCSGSPAVGGTSRHASRMIGDGSSRFAEAQHDDSCDDTRCACQLS